MKTIANAKKEGVLENNIYNADCLDIMRSMKDKSIDICITDPPYGLGSKIIIRPDGKPDYSNASDFMNKWDMPTGDYWEQWFKEAFRVMKYGGHFLMFGMDRQLLLFKYYAHLAGFTEKQSLYWYFIQNFPKSSDLSKMLDKNAGAEREVAGKEKGAGTTGKNNLGNDTFVAKNQHEDGTHDITAPSTPLAKKYSGYKYSIAPLKQTNETILIFCKPTKTGSVLRDTLAYENGDKEITCGALDIDGNRVGTGDNLGRLNNSTSTFNVKNSTPFVNNSISGRYPSQCFCSSETASILDKQSGVSKSLASGYNWDSGKQGDVPITKNIKSGVHFADTGGCSKILHKCDFEEHDLYIYCPKVSKKERNAGCEGMEDLEFKSDVPVPQRAERPFNPIKNNHPTLKPIALNEKVLRLFKTPNEQVIFIPFSGAGSEIIGAIKAGFNWIGVEINPEYVKISEARIKHLQTPKYVV